MIEEKKDNKNLIIGILVGLVIILLIFIMYFIFIKKDNNGSVVPTPLVTSTPSVTSTPTSTTKIAKSTFKYSKDNFALASSGDVIVNGYIVNNNNSISFNITKTDSNDFLKALDEWGLTNNNVSLGCLKDGIISFTTAADEFGPSKYDGDEIDAHLYYSKEISLSSEVTDKLLSSNKDNEITIKLGKKKLSYFINLYDQCKTPITSVSLVD